MDYQFLKIRGAINDAPTLPERLRPPPNRDALTGLSSRTIPKHILELIPESVARENCVVPLALDGDTLTVAAVNADDVATKDKLTFILNKSIRMLPAPADDIVAALNHYYGQCETEAVDSMITEFYDTAIDFSKANPPAIADLATRIGEPVRNFKKGMRGLADDAEGSYDPHEPFDPGDGMFYYTVREGERVLVTGWDGRSQVVAGPARVWKWFRTIEPMKHFVAYPEQFLNVRYRDGRQENMPGPAEVWYDRRVHLNIAAEEALQIAAKEAVVVYGRGPADEVTRRVVHGPARFVPQPGEWLHTFSWHASKGGSRGVQKVPNALVFQKLWMMPDQMYHDVSDVRTADDAVLTIRLMIFFELVDVERMLDATHDPIGDFVNAATSDVVAFVGRHDFESFKHVTSTLNDLATYAQLTGRAAQCGYRINKVVYRGYDTSVSLQQMHDQAIEARTRLQLDRATEQQAQELEDFKLQSQLARARTRREEQTAEVAHDLELARRKQEAELTQAEARYASRRQARQADADQQLALELRRNAQRREHLEALKGLGVDLTAFLTQGRADQVIELRGQGGRPHLHLEKGNGK
jgi:hypothetical protein